RTCSLDRRTLSPLPLSQHSPTHTSISLFLFSYRGFGLIRELHDLRPIKEQQFIVIKRNFLIPTVGEVTNFHSPQHSVHWVFSIYSHYLMFILVSWSHCQSMLVLRFRSFYGRSYMSVHIGL